MIERSFETGGDDSMKKAERRLSSSKAQMSEIIDRFWNDRREPYFPASIAIRRCYFHLKEASTLTSG